MKVGDTVSLNLPDTRNWWQRHAPKWLGGKRDASGPRDWRLTRVSSDGYDEVLDSGKAVPAYIFEDLIEEEDDHDRSKF